MYAIMGATGQTGGATLRALLARGVKVRAITRDAAAARASLPAEAEVVEADARDPVRLAAAFEGCTGVFALCAAPVGADDVFDAARRIASGIAEAARRAGLPHVVALSSEGAHLAEGGGVIRTLHDFEAALASAGPAVTRIRATYFMENWGEVVGLARAEGVLPSLLQPLDRPQRMVAAADIGATAAEALIGGAPADTRTINLMGPQEYTAETVARTFADLLGRPVTAVAPPREAWEGALTAAGLGPSYAAGLAAMYDRINAGVVRYEPGVGEERRGRTPLADALRGLTD